MLRSRIIPCLLIRNKGLVKTVNFKDGKYVGDPINAVKIFNEKEVDELLVLDIDASVKGASPDYKVIAHMAAECRMPLGYGGGIKSADQAMDIINLGVEKVSVSSGAIKRPELISDIAKITGSQSVVVVLDVKQESGSNRYTVWTDNGTTPTGLCPAEFARIAEKKGAGEVIINDIQNDGIMKGYDIGLFEKVRKAIDLPITALGGAGSLDDIKQLISHFGIIGAAAGSLFVFKGVYKAVLINYPNRDEKQRLMA